MRDGEARVSDAEPTTFGRYRLIRSLGRGGMAETFLAERAIDDGSSIVTCLKRILPGLLDDPELARQFEVESRIAATLRHANIAGLLDHGVIEGRHYLALEFVDGVDLRGWLRSIRRQGGLADPEIVAEVAFGVAHALDFAHAIGRDGATRGVIHRDLSPSNILLGRNGEVKLADFGIAKITGASHHTRTGILRGKIPYMPPEYVRGGKFTASGDLFALGVTLFECLAGKRPFDGASDAETLDRLVRGDRRSLREFRDDLDDAWHEALDALLDPSPESRPERAHDALRLFAAVAPRASTRGRLAALVDSLAPRESDEVALPYAATVVGEPPPPDVAVASAPPDAAIASAPPDAATRTRLPR